MLRLWKNEVLEVRSDHPSRLIIKSFCFLKFSINHWINAKTKPRDATIYFMVSFCFKPLMVLLNLNYWYMWPTYLYILLFIDEDTNLLLKEVLMYLKFLQDKQLLTACEAAQSSTFHLHVHLQFLVPQKAKLSIKVDHQCVDLEQRSIESGTGKVLPVQLNMQS